MLLPYNNYCNKIYIPLFSFLIMVENNQVHVIEVKRNFLLANAGKNLFIPLKRRLEDEYQRVIDEIFSLDEKDLDERITDKVRLSRYNNFDWYKGQGNSAQIGTWPKMCSLDARLTTGNVLDTAQMIEEFRKGNIKFQYDNKDEMEKRTDAFRKFLGKSNSIRRNLDFIYQRFPIILFPGGEVREKDYNVWARENNSPIHTIFEYDLDDGNSRAVSYALEGIQVSPCFFGVSRII
jgi:hypothetical protein